MGEQVILSSSELLVEDMTNGNGFRCYMPGDLSQATGDQPFMDVEARRFSELPDILRTAGRLGSVLVSGEPGAGKTNLIRDIEEICQEHRVPSFRLSLHINAGKRRPNPTSLEALSEFERHVDTPNPGLLILDNADYVAYTSKSRSKVRAVDYGELVVPALIGAMRSPGMITVGTAHTEEWRSNHRRWDIPEVDAMQDELLDNFEHSMTFEGSLAATGLRKVLEKRLGYEHPLFTAVLSTLRRMGVGSFHVANHIDPTLLLEDPDSAIAEVYAGRQRQMRAKTSAA